MTPTITTTTITATTTVHPTDDTTYKKIQKDHIYGAVIMAQPLEEFTQFI